MKSLLAKSIVAFAGLSLLASNAALAAPEGAAPMSLNGLGFGLAVGLTVLGAGIGIGRIGGSSVEATARQPEMAGRINTMMLLTAALVEGVALFAVIVGLLKG
ncbi:MAG: ATP synthase F0 subunit C [Phycisphaerales bacterium]